jgi:hypothetical protein
VDRDDLSVRSDDSSVFPHRSVHFVKDRTQRDNSSWPGSDIDEDWFVSRSKDSFVSRSKVHSAAGGRSRGDDASFVSRSSLGSVDSTRGETVSQASDAASFSSQSTVDSTVKVDFDSAIAKLYIGGRT